MDGAIGCIPLCSDDLRLPSPECPNPRRVKLRNKCCEEWVCAEGGEENRLDTAMAGEWWVQGMGTGDGSKVPLGCGSDLGLVVAALSV